MKQGKLFSAVLGMLTAGAFIAPGMAQAQDDGDGKKRLTCTSSLGLRPCRRPRQISACSSFVRGATR